MSENKDKTQGNSATNDTSKKMNRRDVIKGLATLPVVGALAYGAWKKKHYDNVLRSNIRNVTDLSSAAPEIGSYPNVEPKLRIGIIGFGGRGEHLLRAAGFAHPDVIDNWKESALKDSNDKRYEDYLAQDDLNLEVNGICDLFDVRAERALSASANKGREGSSGTFGSRAKRYTNYKDLLAADDIDAVIIGTPDHWHADIVIEAAKHGKHVYVEKGLTRTLDEAFRVREAVKSNNIVFQLGHQGRQTESYIKAKEAIDKDTIGKISLIEVTTNRNTPNGAWVYDIHPEGNPRTIDWEQFEEPCEVKHPFSAERFFRWRCWWDYGTGLSGDLLTHEFDAINQIMRLGIPNSVGSSGGVYYWKDKSKGHYVNEMREVPDVWQVALEYPDRDLTLLYSASLASNYDRGKVIMGHDGYMELGNTLNIYADWASTKYREKIDKGIIDTNLPIYTFIPGRNNVDAVATPTEQYFAGRGLLYTYRGGKRVDTTHLHVKEWIEAIRQTKETGKTVAPSCNIDEAFEEAVAAYMATLSYKEKTKVFWDSDKEEVVI
ncbi:MAG: Gfo/Idh/MocA family protein [Bacteroidales bacterium]